MNDPAQVRHRRAFRWWVRPTMKTRLPRTARWRCRWVRAGIVAEVDVLWTTARRWSRSRLATTPGWTVLPIGPFVIALKANW